MTTYATTPGYTVNEQGIVSPAQITVIDGVPVNIYDKPFVSDDKIVTLKGWPHGPCHSYAGGRVLVPVINQRGAGRKPKGRLAVSWRFQPEIIEAIAGIAGRDNKSQADIANKLMVEALQSHGYLSK